MEYTPFVDRKGNKYATIEPNRELECVEWFDLDETYNECLVHNQKFCVPVKGLETARQYLESMNK